jgi:hypothetical protein
VEDVLAALKSIGAPEGIESNLQKFIDSMLGYELVVETSSNSRPANIEESVAKEDNFEFVVSEYNDAQELLLADPIHEVKEETGWTPEKDSIGYTKEETLEREKKVEA